MNRRDLAKNSFVGLCGVLLGKVIKRPVRDTGAAQITMTMADGVVQHHFVPCHLTGWDDEDGFYTLSDGTAIVWEDSVHD